MVAGFSLAKIVDFPPLPNHHPYVLYPLLNGGEAAIFYSFSFFCLFVAGGGAWSLDRLLRTSATASVQGAE